MGEILKEEILYREGYEYRSETDKSLFKMIIATMYQCIMYAYVYEMNNSND